MKLKIKSHQVGGVVYSPFGPSQQTQTTSSSSSDTKSEKISGTMKEEVIKILKENGIPSDVDAFLNKANSFLNDSTSLSSKSLFGGTDDDYDLSDLITIQKMANDVRWNKGLYDNAVKNLDAEDAWGEVALDSRGWMYVYEDGTIKTVDPHKFDSSKQVALTNEEMVGYRERSSNYAMNSNLLNSMGGTIGMKSVQTYLLGLVEKLGTSSVEGYASKEKNQIINGIRQLMEAGPDGYYKVSSSQQAQDINAALKYLHGQLTAPMRRTLEATIAAEGGDPTKDKYNFIGSILTNHIDSTQKVEFDQSATKHVLEQSNSDKTKTEKDTYLNRIATGQGEYSRVGLAPKGAIANRGGLMVQAVDFGAMLGTDLKSILPQMSLSDLRTQAEALKATFDQDITFGNQIISAEEERGILWDGRSHLTGVMLPYTTDHRGQIKPDLDLVDRYDAMMQKVGNKKLTQTELSSLLKEFNIPANAIDFQTAQLKNTMLFLSFTAYAGEDTIEMSDSTKRWTEEIDRSEASAIKTTYDNMLKYGTTNPTKNSKRIDSGLSKSGKGEFRRGNVYIPIKSPYLGMHMSMNQNIPQSIVNNFAQRSTLATTMAGANNTISGSFE